jgi:hypothetical protein
LLTTPTTLLAVRGDPLEIYAEAAQRLISGARVEITTRDDRAATLRRILAA